MASRRPALVARSSARDPVVPGAPAARPLSPAAVRTTRTRWRDPRLVVGLAVIAVCALLGARALASADDTVSVWTARSALEPGQRIEAADLEREEVRFVEQDDADRYLSGTAELPAGTTVDRAVGAGELLPRSALRNGASDPVTEVPLSMAVEAVPATVEVGSTVDVWVNPPSPTVAAGSAAATRATLVFHDVPVLSAPPSGTSLGPGATRQVTVGVADPRGALLPRSIAAIRSGDVTLTVRR